MSEYIHPAESHIAIRLATQQFGTFDLELPTASTGRDVKLALSTRLREKDHLPNKELRLLYKGKPIENDQSLDELEPIAASNVLNIFAVGQIEKSRAYPKVNNLRLLKRNVDECITCAKQGLNPRKRIRYNDPATPTPPQPNTEYLAAMLQSIGDSFTAMSANMAQLSDMLLRDEKIENDDLYEQSRRLIQNNMDSIRYANPMLLNLTKLRIPLNRPQAVVQLLENNFTPVNRPPGRRPRCPPV